VTDPDGSQNVRRELFDSRFEETGKAVRLLQENANRQPTPEVLEERLRALGREVALRFSEMEKRNAAVAESDQKAIDAALQGQKEAAAKSENSMLQALGALETRFNDTRDSVGRIENSGQGSKQTIGLMMALATLVIAAVVGATVVLSKFGT
jgi:aminopeptidase N